VAAEVQRSLLPAGNAVRCALDGTVAGWHRCQHELVWRDRPVGLYALHGLRSTGGVLTVLVVALGLLGSLVLLRDALLARPVLQHE
jgi:hypothetical protein